MLPVRHRGRVFVDFSCHLCSFDPPPPDLWGETPFPCPDQQWPLQQGPPGSEHGRYPGQDPAAPGQGAPRLCGVIQSHESPSPLLSGWHVGGEEQPAAHHSDTPPPLAAAGRVLSARAARWEVGRAGRRPLCPGCPTAVCVCRAEGGRSHQGPGPLTEQDQTASVLFPVPENVPAGIGGVSGGARGRRRVCPHVVPAAARRARAWAPRPQRRSTGVVGRSGPRNAPPRRGGAQPSVRWGSPQR